MITYFVLAWNISIQDYLALIKFLLASRSIRSYYSMTDGSKVMQIKCQKSLNS